MMAEPVPSVRQDSSHCYVLSGVYAYAIQFVLLAITVSVLVWKWSREQPRRDFSVFILDGSKQLVGAGWAHVFNMVGAVYFNRYIKAGDECTWYWVTIVVDC